MRRLSVVLACLVAATPAAQAKVVSYASGSALFAFTTTAGLRTGTASSTAIYGAGLDQDANSAVFDTTTPDLSLRPVTAGPAGPALTTSAPTGATGARAIAALTAETDSDPASQAQAAEAVSTGTYAQANTGAGRSWFFDLRGGDTLGILAAFSRTLQSSATDPLESGSAETTFLLQVRDALQNVLVTLDPPATCANDFRPTAVGDSLSTCGGDAEYSYTPDEDGTYEVYSYIQTTAGALGQPVDTASPASAGLFGLGAAALLLRRRRG